MPVDSQMIAAMKNASRNSTSDGFTRVATLLSQVRSEIREAVQAQTSASVEDIIGKLKAREALSGEDLRVLRWWIVGDAESYVAMENSYQEWLQEYERLASAIGSYQDQSLAGGDLFKLQGLVEDAMRVAADLSYFLEMKERIAKFEEASRDIDARKADFLMELLSAKLRSPSM